MYGCDVMGWAICLDMEKLIIRIFSRTNALEGDACVDFIGVHAFVHPFAEFWARRAIWKNK